MKIMIHSNGPMVPSGYGSQVRLLLPQLVKLGHEPAVSAFHGVTGSPITWEGIPIYPSGQAQYGVDVIVPHAQTIGAELVITLMDFWKLMPIARELAHLKVAAWLPTDCTPLGRPDSQTLTASRAVPIATSRWGLRNLQDAGWGDALYVPHAVDTSVFTPHPDREALRADAGITDRFVIGINAANRDAMRKAWPEQFRAFALFRKTHPDALLWVHTMAHSSGGFDLEELAADLGISDAVRFSDEYAQVAGLLPPEMLMPWYSCLDLLSLCSYAEGFGIPLIEAQACGTPVVATRAAAMTELCGSGWLVDGHEFWNPVHHAWWTRPDVSDIARRYGRAYDALAGTRSGPKHRERARSFAESYEIESVAVEYWKPALDALEAL